ncbi:MAG: hypothetical protein ABIF85_01560 [Nanoarchaeota archaeon]|nr:hypothetical protein [Nanoarchaeota archaeon]MBU4299733.1 hypothetical protein [Nanoarchaeota archaeon]MBU4452547.1 hypothetical protein [Nanoarchaeota archaeon]MCG2723512.1 hypothetical protein [archaeon]
MRLSESLRRGILKSSVGALINKFKVKSRRTVLFFEEILANYIKACEDASYAENFEKIGERWCILGTKELTPPPIKKLPLSLFFKIMKMVWTTIGILDDLSFKRDGNIIILKAKGNTITRTIGRSNFMIGCFAGVLKAMLSCNIKCIRAVQDKNAGEEYVFEIGAPKQFCAGSKEKETYDMLNGSKGLDGLSLAEAIRKKIFQVKGNRIFFRGTSLCNSENTLFHILGEENIMPEAIPELSYKYFSKLIESDASAPKKLTLLKNLLQIMGWGRIAIIQRGKNIIINAHNPPYGLQAEKDNWNFIGGTILGYLWLIRRDFKMVSVKERPRHLMITYKYGNYDSRK